MRSENFVLEILFQKLFSKCISYILKRFFLNIFYMGCFTKLIPEDNIILILESLFLIPILKSAFQSAFYTF